MKPLYQKLTPEAEGGFVFKAIRAPSFDCPWHAHPEHELILVLKSNGYRIVGDCMRPLRPGDLVLVGAHLPHIWNDEPAAQQQPEVHALILQFEPHLIGEPLLQRPEMTLIRRLFERSARGLHFYGATEAAVGRLMREMESLQGFDRIVQFFRILGLLGASHEYEELASPGFSPTSVEYDRERIDRTLQFINTHLGHPIRLSQAAKSINLSEGAFSRFFRTHTGKTFPAFVNELRIGRACRLLIESDKSVTEISYECGFSNLSNFNRQFLRAKRVSPRTFRHEMQQRL